MVNERLGLGEPTSGDLRWRRTELTRADGSFVPDDWMLISEQLGPVARIYKANGGPRDGAWCWAVQIDAQGRPWNSGTGYCASGKEAKGSVEAINEQLRGRVADVGRRA